MFEWFSRAMRQYATFEGRARRKEYWYFALCYMLLYLVAMILDRLLGTHTHDTHEQLGAGLFTSILSLLMIIPSISVAVRRLHDLDRSGWWWFIQLIPLVGGIIMLVFTCQKGTDGPNRFGPDPLDEDRVGSPPPPPGQLHA